MHAEVRHLRNRGMARFGQGMVLYAGAFGLLLTIDRSGALVGFWDHFEMGAMSSTLAWGCDHFLYHCEVAMTPSGLAIVNPLRTYRLAKAQVAAFEVTPGGALSIRLRSGDRISPAAFPGSLWAVIRDRRCGAYGAKRTLDAWLTAETVAECDPRPPARTLTRPRWLPYLCFLLLTAVLAAR